MHSSRRQSKEDNMKYTHAGVDIEFVEASGVFRATVAGERVTAPSLAGIKTKIDKSNKFEQFTAIVDKGRFYGEPAKGGRFKEVVIVGIKRAKANSYRGADLWVTSTGEHLSEVFVNTPKNLAALTDYDALGVRLDKEKKALEEAHSKARKDAKAALKRHEFPKVK